MKKLDTKSAFAAENRVDFSQPKITGLPRSLRSVLKLLHAHRVSPKLLRNRRLNLFAIRINSLSLNHPSAIPLSQRERVKRQFAFTLAEVLITLGIIGIVAAMIMPAIVSKYRKKTVETSLKKTYSTLTQLVRRSEADNGSATGWEWERTADPQKVNVFFEKYFTPYLNEVSNFRNKSLSKKFYIYDQNGTLLWNYNNTQNANWHTLPDGTAILLSSWGRENVYYGSFDVLIPGLSKTSHLIVGKDVFNFQININKDRASVSVFPSSYTKFTCDTVKNNRAMFNRNCHTYDTSGAGIGNATYCTMLIYCNDWKIPDDYPIKF